MFDPATTPAPSTCALAKIFVRLVIPCILTCLTGYFTIATNTIIAGQLNDPVKLSAVSLGQTSSTLIFFVIALGLNAAQETLTSQAFGAGNMRLVGVYLNRGRFILVASFIVLALLQVFIVEDFFLLTGQDEEVASLAASQFFYLIPGMFSIGQFDLLKRWLACQRMTFAPMVVMLICCVLHVPLALLLVHTLEMDILGLAVASSISYFLMVASLTLYCTCSEQVSQVLQPIDREAFQGWGAQLKASLPIVVIVTAIFWSSNIMLFMAGNMGVNSIAAMSVPNTFQNILVMVSMGV